MDGACTHSGIAMGTQGSGGGTFSGMCQLPRLRHHSMGRNQRRPAQVPGKRHGSILLICGKFTMFQTPQLLMQVPE
jgi:hypothetical protein